MTSHIVGFGRGMIDLKDVVYFLVMTAAFLILNGFSLEGRLKPKARLFFSTAVGFCLIIAVMLNWLLHDLPLGRFDITEGKSHTVSNVSAKILKNLKVPVSVKLYISPADNMPTALKAIEQEITDKLEELRVASDNKFKFQVIHLETVADKGDAVHKSLQEQGVTPFQVESIQKDEIGVKLIYSTLVIEYKEKPSEIIPRIVPQTMQNLEYQLLSRIYKMTQDEKPKVAVFSPVKKEELSPEVSKLLEE